MQDIVWNRVFGSFFHRFFHVFVFSAKHASKIISRHHLRLPRNGCETVSGHARIIPRSAAHWNWGFIWWNWFLTAVFTRWCFLAALCLQIALTAFMLLLGVSARVVPLGRLRFQAIYPGTKDAVHEFVLGSLCGCSVQSDGCVKWLLTFAFALMLWGFAIPWLLRAVNCCVNTAA